VLTGFQLFRFVADVLVRRARSPFGLGNVEDRLTLGVLRDQLTIGHVRIRWKRSEFRLKRAGVIVHREIAIVVTSKQLERKSHLLRLGERLGLLTALLNGGINRERDARENSDDGDHDEE